MTGNSSGKIVPLVGCALVLAAFATAFYNDFTDWDDPAYITENRLVWGFSCERIVDAFSNYHVYNYNPLHLVSYMIDYSLWELRPSGFVLTSVLLHAAAGYFLWRALRELTGKPFVASFVTLVFLVHPTRCESVVWLSERKDVLCGFFAMASFLCFVRALPEIGSSGGLKRKEFSFCAVLFVLALLSKSQIVPLPLVFLAISFSRRRPWLRSAAEQIPLLAVATVFAIVTLHAHAGTKDFAVGAERSDVYLSLLRPLMAFPAYLAHSVFPVGLSPIYEMGVPDLTAVGEWLPRAGLGAGIVTAAAVIALVSWRRDRSSFCGLSWFFLLVAPVSGVVENLVLVADRYLYLALVGPAWIIGDLLDKFLTQRGKAATQAALAAVFAILTAQYSIVWRDADSVWTRVLTQSPDCSVALANLGTRRLQAGRLAEARQLFEQDIARSPFHAESVFGLAEIHRTAGRLDDARALYDGLLSRVPSSTKVIVRYLDFLLETLGPDAALREAKRLQPRPSFSSHQLLFRAYFARDEFSRAREHAEESVKRDPFHEEGWFHLGLVSERLGDVERARAAYRRAIDSSRRFQPAYEALALLLLRDGDAVGARDWVERAPKTTASAQNILAVCLLETGQANRALAAARTAVGLAPKNSNYWINAARVALRVGDRREASEALAVGLRREPKLRESLEPELEDLLGRSVQPSAVSDQLERTVPPQDADD